MRSIMVAGLLLVWPGLAVAQLDGMTDFGEFTDFADMPLEHLLTTDYTVTSAGVGATKLSEVAENIAVLTAEQIRRSGATNLAEVLRLIPGMDVVQITPGHFGVSARVHEVLLANNLMLLIDSRPSVMGFFRSNLWASIPVVLEEIERIEVILGPASVLYGTSATTGVINVITKKPGGDNARARVMAGPQMGDEVNWASGYAGGVWGADWGPIATKVATAYWRHPSWNKELYPDADRNEWLGDNQNITGSLQALWKSSDNTELLLRTGLNLGSADHIYYYRSSYETRTLFADLEFSASEVLHPKDSLSVRAIHRSLRLVSDLVLDQSFPAVPLDLSESSSELKARYTIPWNDVFTTTSGLYGELQRFETELMMPGVDGLQYFGGFINQNIRPGKSLIATVGVRLEEQWLYQENRFLASPQLNLVWLPAAGQVVRMSAGYGFRNPSLLEAYGNISFFDGAIGVVRGDPDILHGRTFQFDLGYQYSVAGRLTLKLDAFFTRAENGTKVIDNPDPSSLYTFINEGVEETAGGEAVVTWTPHPWLGVRAGYGLAMNKKPFFANLPQMPFHRVYLIFNSSPIPELEMDLNLYGMSMFSHQEGVQDPIVINPIVLLNARVAYAVMKELRVVLTAYNLLDLHWGTDLRAGAVDTESDLPLAADVGRRIMLGVELEL